MKIVIFRFRFEPNTPKWGTHSGKPFYRFSCKLGDGDDLVIITNVSYRPNDGSLSCPGVDLAPQLSKRIIEAVLALIQ